jgi:hypothetical protein
LKHVEAVQLVQKIQYYNKFQITQPNILEAGEAKLDKSFQKFGSTEVTIVT